MLHDKTQSNASDLLPSLLTPNSKLVKTDSINRCQFKYDSNNEVAIVKEEIIVGKIRKCF